MKQGLFIGIWLLTVIAGMGWLLHYKATPGSGGSPPNQWQDSPELMRNEQGATLVMFAHPLCPCTRASLNELAIILARCSDQVKANVVFVCPRRATAEWYDSDLRRSAESMPNVRMVWDEGGRLGTQFGMATSGHVLLYDRQGHLQFSGGITALRGHEGDNEGRTASIRSILGGQPRNDRLPVWGCPLFDDGKDHWDREGAACPRK